MTGGQLADNDCVYSLAGAALIHHRSSFSSSQQISSVVIWIMMLRRGLAGKERVKDESPAVESYRAAAVTFALRLRSHRLSSILGV